MAISDTFKVISLGTAPIVDIGEGNTFVLDAAANELLGTYGSASDPLVMHIQTFSPGSTGYAGGANSDAYDIDNEAANDRFRIDGGPDQLFDVMANYSGSVKFTDGSIVTGVTFIVVQDSTGKTYLAPHSSDPDYVLGSKPIESITMTEFVGATALTAKRVEDQFDTSFTTATSDTFEVISLGVKPIVDTTEGNNSVSDANANQLLGTYGSTSDPLLRQIQTFSPGSTGYAGGANSGSYDMDNDAANDTFRIDGGPDQLFDVMVTYSGSVKFTDGSIVTGVTFRVVQDSTGKTYLAPHFNDPDYVLGSKPIESITLTEFVDSHVLTAKRVEDQFVTCFTVGTLIMTEDGERPVETLLVGNRILTADHGLQAIRWIGRRNFDQAALARNPGLRPIRIKAGAMAKTTPCRDLIVSRQHRMLIRSAIVARMTGNDEILMPAIKLVGLKGIDIIEDCKSVTYLHLMCDQHEVIYAEGAETESLFPGPQAMKMIGQAAFDEIATIFPEITSPTFNLPPARALPESGKIAKKIISRHIKNNRQLVSI